MTTLIYVLYSLEYNHLRAGSLSAAVTTLAESRTLAEVTGNREYIDGHAAVNVWLLGFSGNVPEGRSLAARLLGERMPKQWRDFTYLGGTLPPRCSSARPLLTTTCTSSTG